MTGQIQENLGLFLFMIIQTHYILIQILVPRGTQLLLRQQVLLI